MLYMYIGSMWTELISHSVNFKHILRHELSLLTFVDGTSGPDVSTVVIKTNKDND